MTASDVREKDREAAEHYSHRSDGIGMVLDNDLYDAFLAGIQHARSEQAQLAEALDYLHVETYMLLKIAHTMKRGFDQGISTVPNSFPHRDLNYQIPRTEKGMARAEEAIAGWGKRT